LYTPSNGDQITASIQQIIAIMKFLVDNFQYYKKDVKALRNRLLDIARKLSKHGVCDSARRILKLVLSLEREKSRDLSTFNQKSLLLYAL